MCKDQVVSVPTTGVWEESDLKKDLERTADDCKLAYTAKNAPVHLYVEELSRILTKLDSVESGGDRQVRNKRRNLARRVEKEAERVEKLKVLIWRSWAAKQKDSKGDEAMSVDEIKELSVDGSQMDASVEAAPGAEDPSSQPVVADPSSQPQPVSESLPEGVGVDTQDPDTTSPTLLTASVSNYPEPTSSSDTSVTVEPAALPVPSTHDRHTEVDMSADSEEVVPPAEASKHLSDAMDVDTETAIGHPQPAVDSAPPIVPGALNVTDAHMDQTHPIATGTQETEDSPLEISTESSSFTDPDAISIIVDEPAMDADSDGHPHDFSSAQPSDVSPLLTPETPSSPRQLVSSDSEDSDAPPQTPPALPTAIPEHDSESLHSKHLQGATEPVVHEAMEEAGAHPALCSVDL
jgi:hypothetical protein